jgi:hypothetical protein
MRDIFFRAHLPGIHAASAIRGFCVRHGVPAVRDFNPDRHTPLENRMSELWNWFHQSIAYVVATAGFAALCLVAMRFVA